MSSAAWEVDQGREPWGPQGCKGRCASDSTQQEAPKAGELHKEFSYMTHLSLRDSQEEVLGRLSSPMGIVSSILAGALLTVFLNPPQTIYNGFDADDWLGCCKNMSEGTCWRFAVAYVAVQFMATCCSILSLVFIVGASLKATAAASRPDKLEGSSAALANFIAAKWTLFACVYQSFIVMLLYVPLAYPIVILILSAAILGVGTLLTGALFWGSFWRGIGKDVIVLRRFFLKKTRRFRSRPQQQQQQQQQQQEGGPAVARQLQSYSDGSMERVDAEGSQPPTARGFSQGVPQQARRWNP